MISREPWPDVMNNWSKTFQLRQASLIDPNGGGPQKLLSLSAYCKKWEVLTLPQGYTLVSIKYFLLIFNISQSRCSIF